MKDVLTFLGWILGFLIVVLIFIGIFWGFAWVSAPFRGSLDARNQIQGDGSFRIAAYNKFFNDCANIQANEARLEDFYNQIETASPEDKSRIQTNISGVQGLRSEAIAKYNADSRKEYTEAQFKDSDLPYQLPTGLFQKGDKHISCGTN